MTKKPADQLGQHTLLVQASNQVIGFAEQIQKLKVNLSISGRTHSTFQNYSRLLAVMALHFKCLPTDLTETQINDYLYYLQQQHNTPSETYFKHTIYGLRALFKVENISSDHIKLPKLGVHQKVWGN